MVANLAATLLDPNRLPSAGQPPTCSTLHNRCPLTDDGMFARSDDASASTNVGEKQEILASLRDTTDDRGGDREVTMAALAEGIEDGQKIAAIVMERLRELDKSEMVLLR